MKKIITFAILIFLSVFPLKAQSGMDFNELAKKLGGYYDAELIEDLQKDLPQGSKYTIWGWDVGDFSGDGFNDLAFTVKLNAEKRKIAIVFMYIDIDGYLTNVAQYSFEYVDLPLEIGVSIKDDACYITHKQGAADWFIKSYRYADGSLFLLDESTFEKKEYFNRELYKNYQSCYIAENITSVGKPDQTYSSKQVAIPSYFRGQKVFNGFAKQAEVNKVDFAIKGAYNWTGEKDASFSASSSFDDQYLYFTLKAFDDKIVPKTSDSAIGDYFDLWFDFSAEQESDRRFTIDKNKLIIRNKGESGIFHLKLLLGDFLEKKPQIRVSAGDEFSIEQKEAINYIKIVANPDDSGYTLKFKIPFKLFGYDSAPISVDAITDIGCTILMHDIDNEFRPEEETVLASSEFVQGDPSTFGSIFLIPKGLWYGASTNVFKEAIIRNLQEIGF